MPPRLRLLCMLLAAAGVARAEDVEEAPTPQSQEEAIHEAVYRSHAALTEMLLDETNDAAAFTDLGDYHKSRGRLPQAANAYLIALRTDPKYTRARYQLACTFVHWDQKELALQSLTRAVDDGFWGWRLMTDDAELAPLRKEQAFERLTERVKARYDVEAPKHAPGQTVRPPATPPPADGYPVIVLMHGMGSRRADYEPICDTAAGLGVVGVALDGSIVAGEGSYVWDDQDIAKTHEYIQKALGQIEGGKVDRSRIFVGGFSQGANRAIALAARYPGDYAGIIANGAGGEKLIPDQPPQGGILPPLYIFVGDREHRTVRETSAALQRSWQAAGAPVERFQFAGGHQFPPDSKVRYQDAMAWLLQQSRR